MTSLPQALSDWWLPLLFPGFFVGLWCAIAGILAWAGGWTALAAQYGTDQAPPADRRRLVSGLVGCAQYRSCLVVGSSSSSSEGLYLAVFPLFRPFHPPLLIPWTALTLQEPPRLRGAALAALEVSREGGAAVLLRLPVDVTRAFEGRIRRLGR
jgi:hypothetical protein